MRQRFEQQYSLGVKPISEVYIRTKCRDELPPVLVALQKIFITPELNQQVFDILEEKICSDNNNTGRPGMDLWHILVLGVVRLTLNTNWDRIHYLSNNDMTMRSLMGLRNNYFEDGFHEFEYQNILDNVFLLDEATINKINSVVVNFGIELLKKKRTKNLN